MDWDLVERALGDPAFCGVIETLGHRLVSPQELASMELPEGLTPELLWKICLRLRRLTGFMCSTPSNDGARPAFGTTYRKGWLSRSAPSVRAANRIPRWAGCSARGAFRGFGLMPRRTRSPILCAETDCISPWRPLDPWRRRNAPSHFRGNSSVQLLRHIASHAGGTHPQMVYSAALRSAVAEKRANLRSALRLRHQAN